VQPLSEPEELVHACLAVVEALTAEDENEGDRLFP